MNELKQFVKEHKGKKLSLDEYKELARLTLYKTLTEIWKREPIILIANGINKLEPYSSVRDFINVIVGKDRVTASYFIKIDIIFKDKNILKRLENEIGKS